VSDRVPDSSSTPSILELSRAIADADFGRATDIVRAAWFTLLRDHGDEVREALDIVPPAVMREYPLLTMMLGLGYNGVPHRRVKALRLFTVAVRAAHSNHNTLDSTDRALILAAESAAYRLLGLASRGTNAARSSLRVLDSMSETERQAVNSLPRIYSQVGISLYYGGELHQAIDAFTTGLAETSEERRADGFGNLSMLAGIHALRGNLPESENYLELARSELWTDTQRSMYTGTFYRVAEATTALERFDTVAAHAQLGAMVHDRRTIEHWLATAQTEAFVHLIEGRPGAGLAGLDTYTVMRMEGRSMAVRRELAPIRALLQLALGSPDAAGVILHRDGVAGPARHVARARVDLVLGRNGAALSELRAVAGADLPFRTIAEAATVEAAVLIRFSTSARTAAVLEQLGALLDQTGLRLPLALIPPADLELVRAELTNLGFGHLFDGIEIRSVLPNPAGFSPILSKRESVVLQELMHTSSVSQIASDLIVSVNTVKSQLRSVYRKLGVTNRDEAIAVALDRHLLVECE
jgi:DNA-binding CsgD family transcriptional regulator